MVLFWGMIFISICVGVIILLMVFIVNCFIVLFIGVVSICFLLRLYVLLNCLVRVESWCRVLVIVVRFWFCVCVCCVECCVFILCIVDCSLFVLVFLVVRFCFCWMCCFFSVSYFILELMFLFSSVFSVWVCLVMIGKVSFSFCWIFRFCCYFVLCVCSVCFSMLCLDWYCC